MSSPIRICLSASLAVQRKLKRISKDDFATIIWRAESLAGHRFKSYETKWEDQKGSTGEWPLPILDQIVTLHWRYEGVRDNAAVFYIGDVSIEPKEKTEVSVEKTKLKWGFLAIAIASAILTLTADNMRVFGDAVNLVKPAAAILTAVMAYLTGK